MFAKVSEVRMCVWRKSNLDAARAPGSAGGKELVKNFDISCCHHPAQVHNLERAEIRNSILFHRDTSTLFPLHSTCGSSTLLGRRMTSLTKFHVIGYCPFTASGSLNL